MFVQSRHLQLKDEQDAKGSVERLQETYFCYIEDKAASVTCHSTGKKSRKKLQEHKLPTECRQLFKEKLTLTIRNFEC